MRAGGRLAQIEVEAEEEGRAMEMDGTVWCKY